MKKIHNKNNGITLVALVVTIIILLILAGISIASWTVNGLFEKAKLAKEKQENAQITEDETLGDYENIINSTVAGSRDTITLTTEEYNEFKRKGYTLLWEGTANTQNTPYMLKEESMDVMNYDFILIEYIQNGSESNGTREYRNSTYISSSSIKKGITNSLIVESVNQRYTTFHFIDNGFIIDTMGADSSFYQYISKIYGINI